MTAHTNTGELYTSLTTLPSRELESGANTKVAGHKYGASDIDESSTVLSDWLNGYSRVGSDVTSPTAFPHEGYWGINQTAPNEVVNGTVHENKTMVNMYDFPQVSTPPPPPIPLSPPPPILQQGCIAGKMPVGARSHFSKCLPLINLSD